MIKLSFLLALSLNSLAVILFFLYAYRQRGKMFNAATLALFLGTAFLGLTLLISGLREHRHPSASSFESYNFFAFLILLFYFIAESKFKIRLLGTFLPPFALLFNFISLITSTTSFQIEGVISTTLFSVHTAFAFLGEASFVLSFVASVMYLIQESHLRAKTFKGLFFKLPSLSALENTANFFLLLGFPFLTVGILLGFLLAAGKLSGNWVLDPKITWTLITWVVYSFFFMKRASGKLRGKKFAWFLVIGFIVVVICYGAANYFSSFHNFIFSSGANS